ncbi:pyrroloquinoline quinone biosynthesis peptide chaperone PqqD [Paraburkholderia sp. Tr-20389]|uniref:pyrroloquinoline quinone biosynthesis peptide chaperone PqqD n=1 Tax=Paraburkholderia sp. Tr-20389 TaxID=2703903 RepID=UPI00197D1AF9|nr:pyrroloquinoline quinone biosynthesis peptide chaperone PqqD [Paraburkholderia sp. Tr-20389]MBN3758207.1 pyrroloquinoline quinone biosynthesis peptide chaperone PqqD [Paraburkholderia sp. Tr-20389]
MNTPTNDTAQGNDKRGPKLSPLFRLQWEPAQDAHVLLYPEGMVKLNQSAAQILLRCDGTRDLPTLIAELEQTFNAKGLAPEVEAFVDHARSRGWLE